jgi:hypothetical protein
MAQNVLNSFMPNPNVVNDPDQFFKFGRTVDQLTNGSYKNYNQMACRIHDREGIINVLINYGKNPPPIIHSNPGIYRPNSEFKYNLFDSHYTNIVLINP